MDKSDVVFYGVLITLVSFILTAGVLGKKHDSKIIDKCHAKGGQEIMTRSRIYCLKQDSFL